MKMVDKCFATVGVSVWGCLGVCVPSACAYTMPAVPVPAMTWNSPEAMVAAKNDNKHTELVGQICANTLWAKDSHDAILAELRNITCELREAKGEIKKLREELAVATGKVAQSNRSSLDNVSTVHPAGTNKRNREEIDKLRGGKRFKKGPDWRWREYKNMVIALREKIRPGSVDFFAISAEVVKLKLRDYPQLGKYIEGGPLPGVLDYILFVDYKDIAWAP